MSYVSWSGRTPLNRPPMWFWTRLNPWRTPSALSPAVRCTPSWSGTRMRPCAAATAPPLRWWPPSNRLFPHGWLALSYDPLPWGRCVLRPASTGPAAPAPRASAALQWLPLKRCSPVTVRQGVPAWTRLAMLEINPAPCSDGLNSLQMWENGMKMGAVM